MANMSSMPTFYIIVPGFNVSKYLNDLAQSLLRQSYKGPKTVIFVDDGSSDNTLQIMETLDIEGYRKHVIPIDHGGLSIARNAALTWVTRNADNGYIIFLDADDMLTDNALQTIADRIAHEHLDILTFNTQVFYEDAQLEQSLPISNLLSKNRFVSKRANRSGISIGDTCERRLSPQCMPKDI